MIVAIHQPNFFPWLGFFDKIVRSDVFIFLDDVQIPKTGGVWCNRVKILEARTERWLTAPIGRSYSGVRPIMDVEFVQTIPWRRKMLRSLQSAYRKANFFREAMELIEPMLMLSHENVANYNIATIEAICTALALDAPVFMRSSNLEASGQSTERLIQLTRAVHGDTYLCGGGASEYQDDDLFTRSGIGLLYQKFVSSPYTQIGVSEFVHGLSIIDALMNCGVLGTAEFLRRRRCS